MTIPYWLRKERHSPLPECGCGIYPGDLCHRSRGHKGPFTLVHVAWLVSLTLQETLRLPSFPSSLHVRLLLMSFSLHQRCTGPHNCFPFIMTYGFVFCFAQRFSLSCLLHFAWPALYLLIRFQLLCVPRSHMLTRVPMSLFFTGWFGLVSYRHHRARLNDRSNLKW